MIEIDAALNDRTFDLLCQKMENYGNCLGTLHREALRSLTTGLISLAVGATRGRFAYPLNCGLGKTQSVIALCDALHVMRRDNISVAVAASKVEALCEMKRDMLHAGIPEERIGLLHSYGADASLPATEGNDERQFVLVTHNRIKGNGPVSRFNGYRGEPRSLLVWDESLLVSDARALSFIDLKSALGWIAPRMESDSACMRYLTHALGLLEIELQRQKQEGGNTRPILLPELGWETLGRFKAEISRHAIGEPLRQLLEMSTQPLRAVYTVHRGGTGLVTYDIAVPPELESIAILDASYPIRELERLDPTIRPGMQVNPAIKLHNNVVVHYAAAKSGRSAMTKDFATEGHVSAEVAEVVMHIPPEDAVIIWAFKPKLDYNSGRRGRPIDFKALLQDGLKAAGIDVEATVEHLGVRKPRFIFLTWGMETSTSEYGYASNMIFAGVLHRNMLDIASCIVGQRDDLWSPVDHAEVRKVMNSEITHAVYQAICRGSCRFVEGNQARAMRVWLFHHDPSLRDALTQVMPGLQWRAWATKYLETGNKRRLVAAISAYLASLASTVDRVSVNNLKKSLSLTALAKNTFGRALDDCLEETHEWMREGRSLVRDSFGFDPEPSQ